MKNKVSLFLDSGAFSAWNQGDTIDLGGYIDFVKANLDYVTTYVTLDVLPSGKESLRTQADYEKGAAQSYENTKTMKKAGLHPLPVYHQEEDPKWLLQMLRDGEPYIGISSRKDLFVGAQRKWLDEVFSYLTKSDGRPVVKVHGFGITRPAFLLRYPWFSTDSTTWSLGAGYGKILLPQYVRGVADYTRTPVSVHVSGIQQSTPSARRKQHEGFGPLHLGALSDWLKTELNMTLAEIRYGTNNRRKAWLRFFIRFGHSLTDRRFTHRVRSIKRSPEEVEIAERVAKMKPIANPFITVYFATSLNREWSRMMNEADCRDRLLSYYELMGRSEDTLRNYVKTGTIGPVREHFKADWRKESYLNMRRLGLIRRLAEQENVDGD